MAHPGGGENFYNPKNTFRKAYRLIGKDGFSFRPAPGEELSVYRGQARDGATSTLVFRGESVRHGSVCEACWGYRIDCNKNGIGVYAEAFDAELSKYPG